MSIETRLRKLESAFSSDMRAEQLVAEAGRIPPDRFDAWLAELPENDLKAICDYRRNDPNCVPVHSLTGEQLSLFILVHVEETRRLDPENAMFQPPTERGFKLRQEYNELTNEPAQKSFFEMLDGDEFGEMMAAYFATPQCI